MNDTNNQPDWHQIAEKFDLWLPYLKPVGDDLLKALNAQSGDRILDVASGTGEPALTLARQKNDIDIAGVDAAEGMINVAQKKANNEGLKHIRFTTMPAEKMQFGDSQFDKILCRFGVMLFDNPLAGVKEMHRVLKPAGSFALAVWSKPEGMPTLLWAYQALKNRLPENLYPPLKKVTSMGEPGVIEALLSEADFSNIHVEVKTFYYEFNSFDEYWGVVEASNIMKPQFDALDEKQQCMVRDEVAAFAQKYHRNGFFQVPHEYLLVTGGKGFSKMSVS